MVSYFDLAMLIIIGGFGLFGLWFGLVHALGALIGTIAGVYAAGRFYAPVSNWVINVTGWNANVSKVIIFILVFIIITRLVGFVFWILEKILGIITRLPFIHSLDKILGLVFGLAEGAVVVGVSLYFISRFPVGSSFMGWLSASNVAPPLVKVASILIPLLPEAIKTLHSTVKTVI